MPRLRCKIRLKKTQTSPLRCASPVLESSEAQSVAARLFSGRPPMCVVTWCTPLGAPSTATLRKHHLPKERQYHKKATHQDERDHGSVNKAVLFEGHFGLFPPTSIVAPASTKRAAIQ